MTNPNYPPGTVLPKDVDQADVQDWIELHMEEELLDALETFLPEDVEGLLRVFYANRNAKDLLYETFAAALAEAAKKVANDHPAEIHDALFRHERSA